jgi:ketosteroid isomerase-like protein
MKRTIAALLFLLSASPAFAKESANEQAVWKLEHSYWEYVKAADLEHYKSLWHPNFVGWPSSSTTPVHKDQITNWIANYTKEGKHLKSFTLKPAASRATENAVVTQYWVTDLWVDKNGAGKADTSRITHTWIKTPGGWQIIGGMSAAVTKPRK